MELLVSAPLVVGEQVSVVPADEINKATPRHILQQVMLSSFKITAVRVVCALQLSTIGCEFQHEGAMD